MTRGALPSGSAWPLGLGTGAECRCVRRCVGAAVLARMASSLRVGPPIVLTAPEDSGGEGLGPMTETLAGTQVAAQA